MFSPLAAHALLRTTSVASQARARAGIASGAQVIGLHAADS